ncbi:cell surface protein [Ectobacillus sp. JY-23]|uniref:DUF7507 domain-containing protein n=1 Tax=Ectobacillus sp. JY-23 TaxID=2933872 RepID=UPI001FF3FA46|nr:cell surface protein [Ectobacillus sp. JY-23]UOY92232.1 cell surface protein [Ectobacillus sp. JY-23]
MKIILDMYQIFDYIKYRGEFMAIVNRYSTTTNGGLAITGNTVGLSKLANANQAGDVHAIGAFTTINTAQQVPTFPAGTTLNYTSNSSSAILTLPAGSTVLYAELVWGGNYLSRDQNISAVLNNPITFRSPAGFFNITPDSTTASNLVTGSSPQIGFYVRSANVTTIVQNGGTGTYTAGSVPGLVDPLEASNGVVNHSGWTLLVAYQNGAEPARNLNIYVAGNIVSGSTGTSDIVVSGFLTPTAGPVSGRLFLSAGEGDAVINGDQALFGPNLSSLTALSGPNNPVNNFFASQINNSAGTLDTTGTFGSRNQNAQSGTNISAGRQSWDITAVDVSPYLANSQTTAAIRLRTSGDTYALNTVGIQININAPNIFPTKSVNKSVAKIGDVLTYTITVPNTGNLPANNVILTDVLPNGLAFVPGSVTVNGTAQPTANPVSGINLGTIANGATRTIVFQVTVVSYPTPNPIANQANVNYQYTPIAGQTLNGTGTSNAATTTVNKAIIEASKSVDRTFATIGNNLTYTITLRNTGNITANNIVLTDAIPSGTVFVPGSVTVNGAAQPAANPATGINVPSIAAGAVATVTFQVNIPSVPAINPVVNAANASFQYTPITGEPAITESTATNNVSTQINDATVTINKTVNRSFADIGDVLTYTLLFTNSGNVPANNVILTDATPAGTTFVPNSVFVDGVQQFGVNPANGINIGSVLNNGTKTVRFQVTVQSTGVATNSGSATYQYTVDPNQPPLSKNATSNTVSTQVNNANITVTKATDRAFATLGDVITYTLNVTNSGNTAANNVVLQDGIPVGVAFVPNSVFINGSQVAGADPALGIDIGTVPSSTNMTVTFQVTVTSIPPLNPLMNMGNATYNYTVDPQQPPISKTSTSNSVQTTINDATLVLNKKVDKTLVVTGNELTYTITLTNQGNVQAFNVFFSDAVPPGTVLVPNSVVVNGVTQPGANPSGITIGSIAAGGTAQVSFTVQVVSIPTPNPIPNAASASYNFSVDPNQAPAFETASSNTVLTQVTDADVVVVKTANQATINVGEVLTYTVTLTNNGTAAAEAPQFTDVLPPGLTFVADSFTINGVPQPGVDPAGPVLLSDIPVGGSVTITFQATATSIPAVNPTVNTASITYNPSLPETASSNPLATRINTAIVTAQKSASAAITDVGQTLTYAIKLTNSGNVAADNIVVTDIIPAGTSFVPNSFNIGVVPQLGANPATGVPIGSLPAGGVVNVTFQVVVNTIPVSNTLSNFAAATYQYTFDPTRPPASGSATTNTVVTEVRNATLVLDKSVDAAYADVGQVVTYTTTLTNTGNIIANAVTFSDSIPAGTVFNAGSVLVNGVPQAGNPQAGFSIGSIAPGATTTVIFTVTVTAIPTPNPIPNTSRATYQYTPDATTISATAVSDTVTTQVNRAILTAVKQVSNTVADVGTVLTYTTQITNTGNVAATGVIFTDAIPAGTAFVPNSVVVNGTPQPGNPGAGINIGTIAPGATYTVSFQVTVITLPASPIQNSANVAYAYQVNPLGPSVPASTTSNTVSTQINTAVVTATLSVNEATASINDILTYTIALTNNGNVNATNVEFTSGNPPGTVFVSGSVIINGVAQPGVDITNFATVASIAPGTTILVTYQSQVTSIPPSNTVVDTIIGTYQYVVGAGQSIVTKPFTSNSVTTQIIEAIVTGQKVVSSTFAKLNDTLIYETILTNTGNVVANNLVFTDLIPQGTTFVGDSVSINGVPQSGLNPASGIPFGPLAPEATVAVSFQVTVTSVPAVNPIPNSGTFTYSFERGGTIARSGSTNTVFTQVNDATVVSIKEGAVNNGVLRTSATNAATIGDTITYTVTLTNTGNVPANNSVLTDILPPGTTFVPNSITINGVQHLGINPANGITIGTIDAFATVTISFQVQVVSVPSINPIINAASTVYNIRVNPDQPPVVQTSVSNPVTTQINQAILSATKAANLTFAQIGEPILYTITLSNTGNVAANNITVTDIIPSGTAFVPNSVRVGGVTQPGSDPAVGIPVGTLAANDSVSVTFFVNVTTLPTPNPIPNQAQVSYDFVVDPARAPVAATTSSNTVFVTVNNANVQGVKSVDKAFATIGDTVTYSFVLTNTGNVSANNITLTDSIPAGLAFVPNSVTINGTTQPAASPSVGISVPSILGGATATVSFQAVVTGVPTPSTATNTASISYNYVVTPGQPPVAGSSQTNAVSTEIREATITAVQSATRVASVGDTITYTTVLTNIGNVTAINPFFMNIAPLGTAFVPNSVTINGVPITFDPANGFNVGDIPVGGSVTVSYQATVISIPPGGIIPNTNFTSYTFVVDPATAPVTKVVTANEVTTTVVDATLVINKAVNRTLARVNDILAYTFTITNTGNANASNVVFTDLIPQGTAFVPNSLIINGAINNINPAGGVNLGMAPTGGSISLSFEVTVTNIPAVNPIPDSATLSYQFIKTAQDPPVSRTASSNTVFTTVTDAIVLSNKTVNTTQAAIGDVLTYTITLTNEGNTVANDVTLTDTIPSGTVFVLDSVTVNGISQPGVTPANVNVGTLAALGTATVSFQVTITGSTAVSNMSATNYTFQTDPLNPPISQTSLSNMVTTQVNLAQLSITKSSSVEFADIGTTYWYMSNIVNTGNTTASSIRFTDIVDDDLIFVPNTLFVNGVLFPGDPNTGIDLGSLAPGAAVHVLFSVRVINFPVVNPIPNVSNATFSYTGDPAKPPVQGSTTSGTVLVQINRANIVAEKSVTPAFANIGDTLTYTIPLTNTGNVNALNVIATDNLPSGITFVDGTLQVDGVPQAGTPANIAVGVIAPGATSTITFQVTVTALPSANDVVNTVGVSYTYRVSPIGASSLRTTTSGPVTVQVNNANLVVVKEADLAFADINSTITYTITITNTGNTPANQVIFTDLLPPDTALVNGTLTVDGALVSGNPGAGLELGTIAPGQNVIVRFGITPTGIPQQNPVLNTANAQYRYTVDPTAPQVSALATSGQTQTRINTAILGAVQIVDKATAQVGDTLTYTVTVTNTGNTVAQTVFLSSSSNPSTSFIPGSVTVNGVANTNADARTGIALPDLQPGESAQVTYQVVITSAPANALVRNNSTTNYQYVVDPQALPVPGNAASNIVTTSIDQVVLGITKTADVVQARIGDTITYRVIANNPNTFVIMNPIFRDVLVPELQFVENSVRVNTVPVPGANPINGFQIADIQPNTSTTITFQAVVIVEPAQDQYVNVVSISFMYRPTPTDPIISQTNTSNPSTVTYQAPLPTLLGVTKTSDVSEASLGQTIVYTVRVENAATIPVTSVFFRDLLTPELAFNEGSVTLNGEAFTDLNPIAGFTIDTLAAGETAIITFSATVTAEPEDESFDNTATVTYTYQPSGVIAPIPGTTRSNSNSVNYVQFPLPVVIKTANVSSATVGTRFTYTVSIQNVLEFPITEVFFQDPLPPELDFVEGTVRVDGAEFGTASPVAGFTIGTIAAQDTVAVSFDVTVVSGSEDEDIANTATLSFVYQPPGSVAARGTAESNTNIIPFEQVPQQVTLRKRADRSSARRGQTIVYTVDIINPNTVPLTKVIFQDTPPQGTEFIINSVTVDEEPLPNVNPIQGIYLSDIAPGATVTVSFSVRVVAVPPRFVFLNTANLSFILGSSSNRQTVQSNTNIISYPQPTQSPQPLCRPVYPRC